MERIGNLCVIVHLSVNRQRFYFPSSKGRSPQIFNALKNTIKKLIQVRIPSRGSGKKHTERTSTFVKVVASLTCIQTSPPKKGGHSGNRWGTLKGMGIRNKLSGVNGHIQA